jgi:hypothetical protein
MFVKCLLIAVFVASVVGDEYSSFDAIVSDIVQRDTDGPYARVTWLE